MQVNQDRSRLLIIGAKGYVGGCLLEAAQPRFSVRGTSSRGGGDLLELDLAKPLQFDFEQVHPGEVCLVTAAISSPDICSNQRAYAEAVNVQGTTELITRLLARDARVIFFASDAVYGEKFVPFDESATCDPAGEYAEMKHAVERNFLGRPNFKSIRLSYVFSKEDRFTRYLEGCERRDEAAELFHPFLRAIVHRNDVVEGALALAERWDEFPERVINFGGPAILSRIEFAEALKEVAFPNLRLKVVEPAADFFKNRPREISMQSAILERLLNRPARSLQAAARIEFSEATK